MFLWDEWDRSCRRSFQLRVRRESAIEAQTDVCWRRLLSSSPWKPQKFEVNDFIRFIDCAFMVLSDHLAKIEWICGDIWKTYGQSVTAEFVREVVSREIGDEIEARTSDLNRKLTRVMHRKEFDDRKPVLHHFEDATKQVKDRMSNLYVRDARRIESSGAEIGQERASNNKREALLRRVLREQGMSVHDWATKAEVDYHTADNYLKGKSDPYPATRKKLAHALGFEVGKLPL